jgi:hypothetical protein
MTAPQRDDHDRSGPKCSEFHGPTAVQDGSHSVQNNHFHAPVKRTVAFPWGAVVTSVKNGFATLVVVGILGGGAWWAYDHVQERNQKSNAKRAGCDQALHAFYQGGLPVSLLSPQRRVGDEVRRSTGRGCPDRGRSRDRQVDSIHDPGR